MPEDLEFYHTAGTVEASRILKEGLKLPSRTVYDGSIWPGVIWLSKNPLQWKGLHGGEKSSSLLKVSLPESYREHVRPVHKGPWIDFEEYVCRRSIPSKYISRVDWPRDTEEYHRIRSY